MPFEQREPNLPTAIMFMDGDVVGPFCRHCGWPRSMHGPNLECRAYPNGVLPPSCDCHEVVTETVKVKTGRRTWQDRQQQIIRRKPSAP